MVWLDPSVLGCEAEGYSDGELLKRLHLAIEPSERIWAKAVGPRNPRSHMFDAKPPEPANCLVQSVVLIVEPLAQPMSPACGA